MHGGESVTAFFRFWHTRSQVSSQATTQIKELPMLYIPNRQLHWIKHVAKKCVPPQKSTKHCSYIKQEVWPQEVTPTPKPN